MSLIEAKDLVAASEELRKFGGINGAKFIMYLLRLSKINKIYDTLDLSNGLTCIDSFFKAANVQFEIDEESLNNIPKEGAFITVANHPLGGIDGLLLIKILAENRPNFKVMANFLLKRVAPIANYVCSVNPFETRPDIKSTNGLKQALAHLKAGEPLGIFPAGEVSSYQKGFHVADKEWSNSILRFIKKNEVPVLPIYFDGKNSTLFHLLGKIHPMLRTLKLPSELLNKKKQVIKMTIGKPISVKEQDSFEDIKEYGRFLRANTYVLSDKLRTADCNKTNENSQQKEEIIPPISPQLLKEEIAKFPEDVKLYSNKNFHIYCPPSTLIPNILKEIGRLREITFREVGEGTNKAMDLDEYDLYYHHLFIWDSDEECIVGSYRIGKGKEIIKNYGSDGFYLKSLFKIAPKVNTILNEAVELGRSFIVSEYQKKALPLFLLWKGILSVLLKCPEYRYLIGPVSISNDYSNISKELIIRFIRKYHFNHELAKSIKPRNEFQFKMQHIDTDILIDMTEGDINKLDKYISRFEKSDLRLPVLLKKYLSLNAKIIGFNRDPLFNDCLDGLILLDMQDVPERIIKNLSEELDNNLLKERLEK